MSTTASAQVEYGELVPLVSLTTVECAVCHGERAHFGVTHCSKPLLRGGHEPNCCFNCWTRQLTHSSACPLCRAEVTVVFDVGAGELTDQRALFSTTRQVRQSGMGPLRSNQTPSYRVMMRATPSAVLVAGMGINGVQLRINESEQEGASGSDRRVVVVEESSDSDSERPVERRRVPPYIVADDQSVVTPSPRFPGHTLRVLNAGGIRVTRGVVDEMVMTENDTQPVAYRALARHSVYAAVWAQGRATRTVMCALTTAQLLNASFMVTPDGLCKSCLFPVGLHE